MSSGSLQLSNLPPDNLPFSPHFQLHRHADGVFAAINSPEGWAICNAGIIDLGGTTLVYDAFTAPQAAKDLCQAAEALTGRPASLLINSHFHNDHIWGNQSFAPGVNIISTAKTRELILTEGGSQVQWYHETAQKRLETLQTQYEQTKDEATRQQLIPPLYNYQAIVAALPILQIRLPNLTFSGEMALHGSKRSARLISIENAHCASDAILYLPEDGIVFMEDTLFIDCHPYLADGDPDVVLDVLATVKSLQPSIVVPGHGPIGTVEHLDILAGYIHCLHNLVDDAIEQDLPEEALARIAVPKEFQHFIFPIFFTSNLQFLYQRAKALRKF